VTLPSERRKHGDLSVFTLEDARPSDAEWSAPPLVQAVKFGDVRVARLAFGPGKRGASHEDRRLIGLVASEFGGVFRMASLVSEARRLAATDALTGLMNRRAFVEAMDRERSRSERHMFPLSVLILDVDFFKKVNDTRGHDAGDIVLKGVAAVLAKMARKSDYVARWGGEEFVVALSQTGRGGRASRRRAGAPGGGRVDARHLGGRDDQGHRVDWPLERGHAQVARRRDARARQQSALRSEGARAKSRRDGLSAGVRF
jgi:two-component system cell cycle response regulator